MSNTTTAIVSTIEDTIELKENQVPIENSKAQIVTALSMLDAIYKENINVYAQKVYEFTQKIEQLQSQIELLNSELKPHKKLLKSTQKEVNYALRALETLTEKWCQKSIVINGINEELSNLKHNSNEREQILQHRNNSLKEIDFEIEEMELLLLKNELEIQNLLLMMEPTEQKIIQLKHSIKELEAEKRYIEASQLHTISSNNMQTMNKALPR